MSKHRLTETDLRMALRQRGHTEAQVAELLGSIKADAWDEGYRDGHSDGLSDGHPLFNDREPAENPYREAHDD